MKNQPEKDNSFVDLIATPIPNKMPSLPSQTETAINDLRTEIGRLERGIDELITILSPICIENVNGLVLIKPMIDKQVALAALLTVETYRILNLNRRFTELKTSIQL